MSAGSFLLSATVDAEDLVRLRMGRLLAHEEQEGRRRILRGLGAEFENLGWPRLGVAHRPDPLPAPLPERHWIMLGNDQARISISVG